MRSRRKRAQAESMLVKIILAIAALALIGGLLRVVLFQADDTAAEQICHDFNILKAKAEKKTGGTIPIIPCKVLQKGDIPSGRSYTKNTEGVKRQIADLATRCWWMWAQGEARTHLLDSSVGIQANDEKCFICYTFRIDDLGRDFTPFSTDDLEQYFINEPHSVRKPTDFGCHAQGGKCIEGDSCEDEASLTTQIASSKCNAGEVCCIAKNNQCVSNGGTCVAREGEVAPDDHIFTDFWACQGGQDCYIHKDNQLSYLDYIQFSGGKGHLVIGPTAYQRGPVEEPLTEFKEQDEIYAIMFREDLQTVTDKILGVLKEAIGSEEGERIDGIVIDELRNVNKFCAQEIGAKG